MINLLSNIIIFPYKVVELWKETSKYTPMCMCMYCPHILTLLIFRLIHFLPFYLAIW